MGNHWDRETSSDSDGSGSEGSGDEYDSEAGRTNEEGTSDGGSSRSRNNSLSAAGSGSPPKDTAVRAASSEVGSGGVGGAHAGVDREDGKQEVGAHVKASAEEQVASQPRPEKEVREQDKKKVRGSGKKRPRPRKSMFRIRFRKAHDTYTAEELGATPRRLRRLTLSGVYATNLKEHDIQAYFVVDAATAPGETVREPLLTSDVVRGDKTQQEVAWNRVATMDLGDEMLFADQRLCFSVYQKRQLWSTRVIGYAFVSLRDAFARPNVSMQSTYQVFKEKDEAERRSREKQNSADLSSHSDAGSLSSTTTTNTSSSATSLAMPRSGSLGNLFRRAVKDPTDDDEGAGKVRGHVTMTWNVEESIKLPFCLCVPPLRAGQCLYDIVDHLGLVVAKLEYLGRSKCAWCTNLDLSASPSAASDYMDAEAGPQEEACCNACSMKGWSECVVMWDKKGEVRLGSVFTDVTPRKHARARICDQNDTHFASVRAACTTKPEISTGVRFKIVPTFSELTVRACGSIISGKTSSSSFQVSERRPDSDDTKDNHARRRGGSRSGDVVADINRGGSVRDPANVLVQAGKDAVRSVLIAIGIDEACRLRPRAVYDGVTFKDKFDKEYQREEEEQADTSHGSVGMLGGGSHPSPHGSPFQSPR